MGPGGTRFASRGHLETRWATWFDGLSLRTDSDGTTVIHGLVIDQSALHGLLQKVRDVGLPLISVTRVESDRRPPLPAPGTSHPPPHPIPVDPAKENAMTTTAPTTKTAQRNEFR